MPNLKCSVENGNIKVQTKNIDLKYKDGWTPYQKDQADQKIKMLNEATTIKTKPNRKGTSASVRYKKANNIDDIGKNIDIDHSVELQLGGVDKLDNLNPLDSSVNRSIGAQINNQIKLDPIGTIYDRFTIK